MLLLRSGSNVSHPFRGFCYLEVIFFCSFNSEALVSQAKAVNYYWRLAERSTVLLEISHFQAQLHLVSNSYINLRKSQFTDQFCTFYHSGYWHLVFITINDYALLTLEKETRRDSYALRRVSLLKRLRE